MQSPPFDPVLMFKVLVIRTVNNLSDERAEYLIDDLSFVRFLWLGLSDRVPEAKTVWLFCEQADAYRNAIQPVRCHITERRLSTDVSPDLGCNTGGGPQTAQYQR